jgi:hypothetical protein
MQRLLSGQLTPLALLTALAATSLAAQELTYDRVDLNVSAESEIENDQMIAVVYAEVEDNDQAEAADAVNQSIRWATERARRIDGVELQTMQYSTSPVYAPNSRRISGWIARQSLRLQSGDAAAKRPAPFTWARQQRRQMELPGLGLQRTSRAASCSAPAAYRVAGRAAHRRAGSTL